MQKEIIFSVIKDARGEDSVRLVCCNPQNHCVSVQDFQDNNSINHSIREHRPI